MLLSPTAGTLMAEDDDRDAQFSVVTPLGFRVRVTRAYWATIVAKHPDLATRLEEVKTALDQPDEIRRSRRDAHVLLFYRREGDRLRWVVAVAKRSDGEGFLITAYRTDAIKEGERVWPR